MTGKIRPKLGRSLVRMARRGASLEEIDTSLVPVSDRDGLPAGPRPAMVIARAGASEFINRVNRGLDCFLLSDAQRAAFRAATGQGGMPGRLLSSCSPLRLELASELMGQWRAHWHKHRKEPGRQYMFVTIITDTGNTLEHRLIELVQIGRSAQGGGALGTHRATETFVLKGPTHS